MCIFNKNAPPVMTGQQAVKDYSSVNLNKCNTAQFFTKGF